MGMGAAEARAVLAAYLDSDAIPRAVREAWGELDGSLTSGGELPPEWERYTSGPAAEYVGCPQGRWATHVAKGTAPAPDGHDKTGRAYWVLASLNRVKNRQWLVPPNTPPALTASDAAWRRWARKVHLAIYRMESKDTIIGRARMAGLLPDA